ncbi:MAG: YigZ family protein [Paludibacteraceae bacterium]|nr:YigZ family protein [Paludibacteraceae bacterium]
MPALLLQSSQQSTQDKPLNQHKAIFRSALKNYELLAAEGIYKDRGSKFLSFAEPIRDEDEAKTRIAWYKKKYHDARHVCYAYRLGANLWRTKDDGEPHGTAGAPILRSIDARGLDNILVVVVRYFGGTLLGTGGLMVAYREASKDALESFVKELKS